jgi:hypothetical protein
VRKWKYRPFLLNGEAVPVETTIYVFIYETLLRGDMKHFLAWITMTALFAVGPLANAQQGSGAAAVENGASGLLENGSMLYLELSKTVDAKKAKPGDPVSAVLLADVVSHGKIVLRADSKLLGHVTEAQARTQDNPESRLGIVFDKALLKGGHEMAFGSVLMAVRAAPPMQIASISGPVPPSMNPATNPQQEKHYPSAKTPGVPQPASSKDQGTKSDRDRIKSGSPDDRTNFFPTDIEGLSLQPAADKASQVVVSFKRTVKLESGMRLELRVTSSNP